MLLFVVEVRFADMTMTALIHLGVLLQTFFSACRKVVFDLKKNKRWYKMKLHKQTEFLRCICEFMKRSICLSNLTDNIML